MRQPVIYIIKSVFDGKFYVGSTVNKKERFRNHRTQLRANRHHCKHLQAAWNKYGEDCFKFEVVVEVELEEDLHETEDVFLQEHVGKPYCYNSGTSALAPMRGRFGELHPGFGIPVSKEQKEVISRKLKAFYAERPENHPRYGATLSEESKRKMVASRGGKTAGENHYRYGQKLSDEVKAKISATQKGRPNPRKGMKMSEQGRLNVIAAVKRGADSPFFGKPPTNIEELKKPIVAILPDRTTQRFSSLTELRDTHGVPIATIIRACKSGNPVVSGALAGWVLAYEGDSIEAPEIPEEYLHLPRTRQAAQEAGAKMYFTGLPCSRGHIAPRKTKGVCVECMKENWKTDNEKRKQK